MAKIQNSNPPATEPDFPGMVGGSAALPSIPEAYQLSKKGQRPQWKADFALGSQCYLIFMDRLRPDFRRFLGGWSVGEAQGRQANPQGWPTQSNLACVQV